MLRDMGCYEVVGLEDSRIDPKTGSRYQIIPTKMDLRSKYDAMGHPTQHKGRLVVLDNQEWSDTLQDIARSQLGPKSILR